MASCHQSWLDGSPSFHRVWQTLSYTYSSSSNINKKKKKKNDNDKNNNDNSNNQTERGNLTFVTISSLCRELSNTINNNSNNNNKSNLYSAIRP